MTKTSSRPPACARHQYLLAALFLAVLLGAFFNPIVLDHATFSTVEVNQRNAYPWAERGSRPGLPAQADQAQYSYPRQVFLDGAVDDGVIPLWDPYTLGGHPSFASGPGLAYPPRLILTLLLEPPWTHDIYLVVHMFAAGMAMFAFMKQVRARFLGSLLGAVAWTMSSYSLGWITLEPFAAVAALLPLTLLFVRRWYDRESWPDLLVAGLLLGMLYLGSSSELALISFLVVAGYAAAVALQRAAIGWRQRPSAAWVSAMAAPIVLIGAALCVAAVGLLPLLELLGRVDRPNLRYSDYVDSTYPTLRRTSLSDFLHTFVPPGTPLDPARLISQSAFVGTASALLAVPALFRRRVGAGFARAALVTTLLFIVGSPVTWLAYRLVPGLGSLNGLGRSLFVWNLGVAVLGGMGLDLVVAWMRRAVEAMGLRDRLRIRLALLPTILAVACIAATAAQLAAYGRRANPPFQRREVELLYPATPAVAALRRAQGPGPGEGRVVPLTRLIGGRPPVDGSPFLALPGNAGQALEMRLATGYENAVPDRTLQLWRFLRGETLDAVLSEPPTTTLNLTFSANQARIGLLGRVGVAALFAPPGLVEDAGWRQAGLDSKGLRRSYLAPDGVVLEVLDSAPRASVVSASTRVRSGQEALTTLAEPGFDRRRTVILEPSSSPDPGPVSQAPTEPQVLWLDQGPNGSRLSVTAAEPGWLVILESWDPGWRATVGGVPVDVERANFAFQAVRVPAGTSAVELSYRPPSILWGAAISGGTTSAIVVVVWIDAGRRRRRLRRQADQQPKRSLAPS